MNKKRDYTKEIYSDDKITIQEIYKNGKLFATVKGYKKAIEERMKRKKREKI